MSTRSWRESARDRRPRCRRVEGQVVSRQLADLHQSRPVSVTSGRGLGDGGCQRKGGDGDRAPSRVAIRGAVGAELFQMDGDSPGGDRAAPQ